MAGSFGKSFDEAFRPANSASIAGSFDLIKEKLKDDRAKNEETQSVLNMKQQILSIREGIANKKGDTSVIDNIITGLENSNKKDVVEPIYKAVIDTAKQGPYENLINQGKAAEAANNIREAGGVPPNLNFPGQGVTGVAPVPTNGQTTLAQGNQTNQTSDLVPEKYNIAGVATSFKSKSGMASEEQAKIDANKRKEAAKAESVAIGTKRFMQQFDRSYKELKAFDPEVDKVGVGGFLSRAGAKVAEHLDELPETKALKIQVLPLANGMARDIEGGRVTDNDRTIYANSFASAINFPTVTNIRNMANQLLGLIDKGGNESGKITEQLKEFSKSDSDIFKRVIGQVLIEYPEMAKDIYGDDYEVVE